MPVAASLLLIACAPATLEKVVLLPQSDGRPSAVEVRQGETSRVLDTPYQMTVLRTDQPLVVEKTTARDVAAEYPRLVNAPLLPPDRFVLNFLPGSSALTPESRAQLPQVLGKARERSGGEIVVVGHTDRQGATDANDRLSLQRAQAIRDLLLQQGFDPQLVEAVGRGEREPLVPTDDGVVEPRNRRADVIVR
ncbi:MAG: OmpA family protein [Burkholderiaceae bacterium]